LELTIAVLVLAVALVPIYRHISRQASITVETEKIQMAEKILESIKEELTGMPYENLYTFSQNLQPDDLGTFPLADGMYPLSNQRVVEIQKQYKDFSVSGSWMFLHRGEDTSLAQVEVMVGWTSDGQIRKSRDKKIVLVAPK
jgi:hypothetical protein